MTNFDKIKFMGIEEMAEVIYSVNDKICFDNCKQDTGNKYSCKFGEEVSPENCKGCIMQWLESEAMGG